MALDGPANLNTSGLQLPAELRVLQISQTSMTGALDEALLRQMPDVNLLDLSDNRLAGTIPPFLSQMTALKAFAIDGNFFHGQVPDLSRLTNLVFARIADDRDSNRLCCPSLAQRPPRATIVCTSAPSCNTPPPVPAFDSLKAQWKLAEYIAKVASRLRQLAAIEAGDSANATGVGGTTATAGSPATNRRGQLKKTTAKILARLFNASGKLVAFELEDGSVQDVRTVETDEKTGEVVGYELTDGSFVAEPDAQMVERKPLGSLSKKEVIIIASVSAVVFLAACLAAVVVLFRFRSSAAQAKASALDEDPPTPSAPSDTLALNTDSGDVELRPPTKRARKVIPAVRTIDLPGTNGSGELGDLAQQHGSNDALLAHQFGSSDSLGYSAPPAVAAAGTFDGSAGSGTVAFHGSEEGLRGPKNSSNDALPTGRFALSLQEDDAPKDGTPQLYYASPELQSSALASPEADFLEPVERASSSSSAESIAPVVTPPPPESEPVHKRAKRREPSTTTTDEAAADDGHFSNIKLPGQLKPHRKAKPEHQRKHRNPVPEYDNVVLPAEMRGRTTVLVED